MRGAERWGRFAANIFFKIKEQTEIERIKYSCGLLSEWRRISDRFHHVGTAAGALRRMPSRRRHHLAPFLREAGVHRAQVDLPLVLQLQVGVAEDAHQDAGAHVVDAGLRRAHGDLDLVAGLLVGVFGDVGCRDGQRSG